MCRWFAYSGSPVPVETFLPQAESRLIHQSPHARLGSVTTSGNGFEMSSYREGGPPGFHRTASPAWDDQDLHELAAHRALSEETWLKCASGTPSVTG